RRHRCSPIRTTPSRTRRRRCQILLDGPAIRADRRGRHGPRPVRGHASTHHPPWHRPTTTPVRPNVGSLPDEFADPSVAAPVRLALPAPPCRTLSPPCGSGDRVRASFLLLLDGPVSGGEDREITEHVQVLNGWSDEEG